jgi:hypothetical protein
MARRRVVIDTVILSMYDRVHTRELTVRGAADQTVSGSQDPDIASSCRITQRGYGRIVAPEAVIIFA